MAGRHGDRKSGTEVSSELGESNGPAKGKKSVLVIRMKISTRRNPVGQIVCLATQENAEKERKAH